MEKDKREQLEYISLFCDERFAKKAFKQLIGTSLAGDAKPVQYDDPKYQSPTLQSEIEKMAYNQIKERLVAEGKSREPMQAEMMIECGVIRTRMDNATLNTIFDRTAGKVREEIAIGASQFEDMSDDELEALAAYRATKSATKEE